jgi:hypothetical protein
MKKVLLGFAALAMVACLASCKKSCDCTNALGIKFEYTIEQLNDVYGDVNSCADVWDRSYETLKCE